MASDYGRLSARTDPGAVCNASATLPNGRQPSGLKNPQVAGGNGVVTWTYPQTNTTTGKGTNTVSCTHQGLSATATSAFSVGG